MVTLIFKKSPKSSLNIIVHFEKSFNFLQRYRVIHARSLIHTVWHKSLVHLEYVLISRDWKEISGWLKRHCVPRDERMKDQWSKFQSYNRLPADGETGFGQKKGVRVFWWNKLYTLRQIKCDMFFWNRFVSLQPVVDNPPEKGATKKFLKQKL